MPYNVYAKGITESMLDPKYFHLHCLVTGMFQGNPVQSDPSSIYNQLLCGTHFSAVTTP
jgi:hypothetical protein